MTTSNVLYSEPEVVKGDLEKRVKKINSQLTALIKKDNPKDVKSSEQRLNNLISITKISLNQIYIYLLLNKIDIETKGLKNDDGLTQARKVISALMAYWEKQVGKDFDDLHKSNLLIHTYYSNHKIFAIFQQIGLALDSFDLYLKEDRRWQASLLPLRTRFLIVFCNALNFKVLLKERDPQYENYVENFDIYEVLKENFNSLVQSYWNENVKSQQFNIAEMSKALSLVGFFRSLASVFEDRETHANYKKRFAVWKKYIDEKSEEQKLSSQNTRREAIKKKDAKGKKKFF